MRWYRRLLFRAYRWSQQTGFRGDRDDAPDVWAIGVVGGLHALNAVTIFIFYLELSAQGRSWSGAAIQIFAASLAVCAGAYVAYFVKRLPKIEEEFSTDDALSIGSPGVLFGSYAWASIVLVVVALAMIKPEPRANRAGSLAKVSSSLAEVEFPLGPDFGLVASSRILAFQSLDGELMMVTRFPAAVANDKVADEVIHRFLTRFPGTNLWISPGSFAGRAREVGPGDDRAVWRGKGQRGDQSVRLLAVEIRCAPDDYLAIYLGTDAFPETRALAPMLAARCTAHPREPPYISDLAHLACAGGDQRGCTLKVER